MSVSALVSTTRLAAATCDRDVEGGVRGQLMWPSRTETLRKSTRQMIFPSKYPWNKKGKLFQRFKTSIFINSWFMFCRSANRSGPMTISVFLFPGWWFQPLWKIWKSIGMIISDIWKNKIHVPVTTNQFLVADLPVSQQIYLVSPAPWGHSNSPMSNQSPCRWPWWDSSPHPWHPRKWCRPTSAKKAYGKVDESGNVFVALKWVKWRVKHIIKDYKPWTGWWYTYTP